MTFFKRTISTMRKIPLFLVLAGALVGIGMNASAAVVRTDSHIVISRQIFDPKTNEQVLLSDAEAVVHVSYNANGDGQINVVGTLHGMGKGDSGNDYLFSGDGKASFNNASLPLSEFVLVCDVQLTREGSSNAQQMMIWLSITVNAAGQAGVVFRDVTIHGQ